MKKQITILVIIYTLLTSCTPEVAAQEIAVATEVPVTKTPVMQEPVVTESPISIEPPPELPTEPPLTCMTLLAPENGAELPVTGKVTFSWTPVDEAGEYILNFILPSGSTVSFETDQMFRDRYMEAFVAGGEYQWQVIAQGADGNEICVSEVATFDKPAYEKHKKTKDDSGNDNGSSGDGGGEDGNCDPISGCGGNE